MKNKLLLFIFLLALPFFVTACTLQDLPVIGKYFTTSSQPVTINVWGLWEPTEVIDALIAKYKETHPNVTINYEDRSVIKPDQYKQTIVDRLNQGSDIADVVMVHNTWVGEIRKNLSAMPSKKMTVEAYTNTFYPVAYNSAVVEKNIYAVPVYHDGLVLVYNKKHFAEVDQVTAPTAWEEFRRLALKLKKTENGVLVRGGAALGTANNIDFFSDILGMMFLQAGVKSLDKLDSRPIQDAVSFYTSFATEDKVWDSLMPEASVAFGQEKVSMIFIPTWNLLDIIRSRPDLDIGVAPVPQAVPDNPVSWASFWMYSVPNVSKNKEVAWDFINFLSSEDAQSLKFGEASKYRAYGAPFAVVSMAEKTQEGVAGKYLKPLFDQAPFASSSIFAARSGNFVSVNALKNAVNKLVIPSTNSSEKATVEDVMKEAKDSILNPSSGSEKKAN